MVQQGYKSTYVLYCTLHMLMYFYFALIGYRILSSAFGDKRDQPVTFKVSDCVESSEVTYLSPLLNLLVV
jgi:hypothetical protein